MRGGGKDCMRWLADLILLFHLTFVLFVTGGLLCIWIGAALGWRWVRNYCFASCTSLRSRWSQLKRCSGSCAH
jgi:hypothetical protein